MKIDWSGGLISVLGLLLIVLACVYGAAVYNVGFLFVFLKVILQSLGIGTEAGENKVFEQVLFILLALGAGVLLVLTGLLRMFFRTRRRGAVRPRKVKKTAGQSPDHRKPKEPAG